jgi:hypothetical protein
MFYKNNLYGELMKKNKNLILSLSVGFALIIITLIVVMKNKGIEWKVGSQQLYNFEFNSVIKNINFMTKLESSSIQKITGKLNLKIFDIESGIIKAGFQFSDLNIEESGKRIQLLENIFSTFFLAEFEKNGTLIAFYFDNNIAKEDEALISNIIREFQLVIPGNTFGDWSTEEKDSLGDFSAEYTKSGNQLIKNKTSYSKINYIAGEKLDNVKIDIKLSKLNITPSVSSSWVERCEGNESIEMAFKKSDFIFMKASKEYSLEMISFEPDTKLSIWNNGDDFNKIKLAFNKGEKNSYSLFNNRYISYLRNKLKNENYNSVITKFLTAKDSVVNVKDLLKDYLTIHPEDAYRVSFLLKNLNINDAKKVNAINALSLSNTLKAQEVITDIINDMSYEPILRFYSVVAIGQMKYPTLDSVQTLINVANQKDNEKFSMDISNSAILALGTISNSLKGIKDDVVDIIKDDLKNKLKSTRDPAELSIILQALGNSKNEEFAPEIIPYLAADDSNLRAMAAYSLRDMDDEESLSSLVKSLDKEESPNVKDFILTSLSNRKASEESIKYVKNAISKENNKDVRYNMFKYLIANKEQYRGIDSYLKDSLENDITNKERVLIYKNLYSKKDKS